MKFTLLTLLFSLMAAVMAIDYSAVPQCSLLCFMQAINASGCSLDDTKCQCTTGLSTITEAVTPCVLQSCSAADAAKVSAGSQQICAAYTTAAISGVINSANSAAVAGSTAPATSAAAASGTKSTTPASATVAQATTNAASLLKPFGGAALIGGFMGAMVL